MCQDVLFVAGVSYMCVHIFVTQAWAFATEARNLMGRSKHMNILDFDYGIWRLHRRLFHRFMKFERYFRRATKALPDYDEDEDPYASSSVLDVHGNDPPVQKSVICLLSSDSDEEGEEESSSDSNDSHISVYE